MRDCSCAENTVFSQSSLHSIFLTGNKIQSVLGCCIIVLKMLLFLTRHWSQGHCSHYLARRFVQLHIPCLVWLDGWTTGETLHWLQSKMANFDAASAEYFFNHMVLICPIIYLSNSVQQILLNCILASWSYTEYLLKIVCFWQSVALLGWQCVSVTSAALHLVLIGSKLITPLSVKQCCQTSPAQPCFHSILCSPADRIGASQCIRNGSKQVNMKLCCLELSHEEY